MSIFFKPNKRKRAKKHGFLSRSKTAGGARVLRIRRRVGRYKLATS